MALCNCQFRNIKVSLLHQDFLPLGLGHGFDDLSMTSMVSIRVSRSVRCLVIVQPWNLQATEINCLSHISSSTTTVVPNKLAKDLIACAIETISVSSGHLNGLCADTISPG